MLRIALLSLIWLSLAAAPLRAGEAATAARQALESGQLAQGESDFAARVAAKPSDDEARFGLGMIRFALAIEHFGQRQYRYGAHMPMRTVLPFFRLPLPQNLKPEEITFEKQRENWQALLDDLAKVDATLAAMTLDETEIVVDLNAVHFDFGVPGKTSALGDIVAQLRNPFLPPPATPGPFEVNSTTPTRFGCAATVT